MPVDTLPLPDGTVDAGKVDSLAKFWVVDGVYAFDNVAFSKVVGGRKLLCCPDCEYGPLGYHEVAATAAQEPPQQESDGPPQVVCFVAADRVACATADNQPRPPKSLDSAALAALMPQLEAGSNAIATSANGMHELNPEPEPAREGIFVDIKFTRPMVGLYLVDCDRASTASLGAGGGSVQIGAFNRQQDPSSSEDIPGEAEASGKLQTGDVVCTVHGVDVRGFSVEDTTSLVIAAPRPFVMRFWRSTASN